MKSDEAEKEVISGEEPEIERIILEGEDAAAFVKALDTLMEGIKTLKEVIK